MKYALVVAALATFVSAQVNLGDLPQCAQQCLPLDRLESFGCSSTLDFACFCQNDSFIDGISCCVSQQCQGDEIAAALDFAGVICADSGVQLPTEAGCTGAAATGATPSTSGSVTPIATDSMSMTDAPSSPVSPSGSTTSEAAPADVTSPAAGWRMAPAGGAAGVAAVVAALL